MVTINLLPWRDKQTKYEWLILRIILVSAALLATLVVIAIHLYLNNQQALITDRLIGLKKEMAWRVGLAKVNVAGTSDIPIISHENLAEFFNRLNQTNTNKVCIEEVKKTKDAIDFIGVTDSTEQLTDFLRSSPMISYFSEIKVKQLQSYEGEQLKFYLAGKLHAL